MGQESVQFEFEPPESRDFPGYSGCHPGVLGVGCAVLTRAASNFYRLWYEPEMLNSYEISKICSLTCQYRISVKHTENILL